MPRKARIDAPGALHHIICRGIERRRIFYDNADRDDFLKRLSVRARSVLAYWAVRELGISGTKIGKKLSLSQSAVNRAVQRGEQLVLEYRLSLYDTRNA